VTPLGQSLLSDSEHFQILFLWHSKEQISIFVKYVDLNEHSFFVHVCCNTSRSILNFHSENNENEDKIKKNSLETWYVASNSTTMNNHYLLLSFPAS